MAHFGSGFLACEHPIDFGAALVSLLLPGGDLAFELFPAFDPPVQTLAAEHADLDLHHVQPAGVLGGVVEFQELWWKLGDDGLKKAAYRGGWRSLPEPLEGAIRHED